MKEEIIITIINAFIKGRKLLIFGNGGSAAEASHLASEFIGKGFPAIALTDPAVITSLANDFSYKEVFSRWIKALGIKGDVAIGMSSSGRSKNVILGLKQAKSMGMKTIDWPRFRENKNIIDTAFIQENQLKLIHDVYIAVDEYFYLQQ